MEVEMVLREVGEDHDRKARAVRATQLQTVRGDFDRRHLDTGVDERGELRLELGRLGRGDRLRLERARTPHAERAPDRARLGRGAADRLDHPGHAALPVGAGDADRLQAARRMLAPGGGQESERFPAVVDLQIRLDARDRFALSDDERRARLARAERELMAVPGEAGKADEHYARGYAPGIVMHAGARP